MEFLSLFLSFFKITDKIITVNFGLRKVNELGHRNIVVFGLKRCNGRIINWISEKLRDSDSDMQKIRAICAVKCADIV